VTTQTHKAKLVCFSIMLQYQYKFRVWHQCWECSQVQHTCAACCRDANSPAKPLMISSAISLPPIGELTTMRSDIDSAVLASNGAVPSSSAHPTGQLSKPPSPHQADTPTFSQRPTSPFAAQSGEEHQGESKSCITVTSMKWCPTASGHEAHSLTVLLGCALSMQHFVVLQRHAFHGCIDNNTACITLETLVSCR